MQTRAYGAEIELIAGTRQDMSDAAERQAATIFYAGHNWQPFFLQGTKTLAYELWEDLKFAAPDNVIIPTGAGSNVIGCDIGFGELLPPRRDRSACPGCSRRSRKIARRSTQASWPDPTTSRRSRSAPTIAEGASIAKPCGPAKSWRRCRRSGGATVAVSEAEIEGALFELAGIGLYAEPTSALAAAAFTRLLDAASFGPARRPWSC